MFPLSLAGKGVSHTYELTPRGLISRQGFPLGATWAVLRGAVALGMT